MMSNHSQTGGDRSHLNSYSGNSTTPPESSVMRHQSGISMEWTAAEQETLDDGLVIYASADSITRYAKIAFRLENKTVRDIAMRCSWINKKRNNNKRRKENARVDNKEIIDMMVASNSVPYSFAPSSLLRKEDEITNEMLKQNDQLFNQISANHASSMFQENLTPFYNSRENIRKLLKILNGNVPESMKYMPPLPVKIDDELSDAIFLLLNRPMNE